MSHDQLPDYDDDVERPAGAPVVVVCLAAVLLAVAVILFLTWRYMP